MNRPLTSTTTAKLLPSLDGLRAVAIGLVLLAHSGFQSWVPGGFGVTLFFVISGYLITSLMRSEIDTSGKLNLRNFYQRRCLRLYPPLLLVIIITGGLSQYGLIDGVYSPGGLLAALLYFSNYQLIFGNFSGVPAGLGVLWSLAIEEHFYLAFPPLFILLQRRWTPIKIAYLLALLCAAILGWRFWLYQRGASEHYLQMATDTRVDAVLAGCLMALVRHPTLDPIPNLGIRKICAVVAICALFILTSLLYRNEQFRLTLRYSLQIVAIAPLIYLSVTHSSLKLFSWLNWEPLKYVGQLSYVIYLSHHVIYFAIVRYGNSVHWTIRVLAVVVGTAVFSMLVHHLVERPFAKVRRRLHNYLLQEHNMETFTDGSKPSIHAEIETAKISVCIATYQRPERLRLLLNDLTQQIHCPYEVIVVDNDCHGSARDVVVACRSNGAPFKMTYAIQPKKNISATRNRSVELASGDWLAFVDDDERAPTDWIQRLVASAYRYRADGVLGPVLPGIPPNAPTWIRRGKFYDWARIKTGEVIPPNGLRFGNVLLSRASLSRHRQVFDPHLGLTGGEDGDLLNRLRLGGAKLVWCDEAVIHEPVEAKRLSLGWLLRRSLRGGQDFAAHTLRGRYGPLPLLVKWVFFARALLQMIAALALTVVTAPFGRHRSARWLMKAAANAGKLSVLAGWHYREYASTSS